ncbi:uncharacterized protein LOC143300397 [Babylonia areolata]|uniref:uncharacterized protein LOC143300397 n=1 Tax=Babylonia areolata TaxID=304850 RepID=UPI003FD353B0
MESCAIPPVTCTTQADVPNNTSSPTQLLTPPPMTHSQTVAIESNTDSPVPQEYQHTGTKNSGEREQVPLCPAEPTTARSEQFAEAQRWFEPQASVQGREVVDTLVDVTSPEQSVRVSVDWRDRVMDRGNFISWCVLSLVSILCCGWFLGFLPLIFVMRAVKEQSEGHHSAARHSLIKARVLLGAALMLGTVTWIAIGYRVLERTSQRTSSKGLSSAVENITHATLSEHLMM